MVFRGLRQRDAILWHFFLGRENPVANFGSHCVDYTSHSRLSWWRWHMRNRVRLRSWFWTHSFCDPIIFREPWFLFELFCCLTPVRHLGCETRVRRTNRPIDTFRSSLTCLRFAIVAWVLGFGNCSPTILWQAFGSNDTSVSIDWNWCWWESDYWVHFRIVEGLTCSRIARWRTSSIWRDKICRDSAAKRAPPPRYINRPT